MESFSKPLSRRHFLSTTIASTCFIGAGVTGACLGLPTVAKAQTKTREYHLNIAREKVNLIGGEAPKITVNGTIPGPILYFNEGDEAVIHVTNTMGEDTSVHWHGLLLAGDQDGAPGFNGVKPIKPAETFTYRFPIRQAGIYWYHSHSLGQEQDGLYGSIVISPKIESVVVQRDYVVLLSDYSAEDSSQILKNLKKSSDYYQYRRRTIGDLMADVKAKGFTQALKKSEEWGKMRMLPTDLSDVSGYHFLVNGMTNAHNWQGLFTLGEKIRLRFINAGTMTFFDVRIPGLRMKVIACDGQDVEPIEVDEFRIGCAETYDVIVEPNDDNSYTIVAESLDREGFAVGVLATQSGTRPDIPTQRKRAILSMADMNMAVMMKDDPNMDMSNMDHVSGWAQTDAPNGAKVLNYADLRCLNPHTDTREPTRDIEVRLGGNMTRYIWTMNGETFDPKNAIKVAFDERVRISYINETMMAHPIHLHGMFVQLENGQEAQHLPLKHTVIVPPGKSVSVLLSANEAGSWPLHCHLLYHMAAGMMTTFEVAAAGVMPFLVPSTTPPTEKGVQHEHH